MDLNSIDIMQVIGAVSVIYSAALYFLPKKYAKKLKPIGKILRFLANTKGGFKTK